MASFVNGLIQSTGLPRRKCTGISLMELIFLPALDHLVSFLFPTAFVGCLPDPPLSPVARSRRFRRALGTTQPPAY
jgi:hypothetical protein